MRSDITPGQTSDYLGFDLVMDDNLPEPSVLLADRGYDSDKVRETMEARNVVPVIPMRKSRKLRVAVDRTLYRLRNRVERCFNKLKNARRVATRYDKTAESFLGFIDITSIRLWLRHLSTRPRGALIPRSVVRNGSKFTTHTNSSRFMLRDDVWNASGVEDVTAVLRAVEYSA
jgi:transposase